MELHNKQVKYLTFKEFDKVDFIKHGVSTKIGGVSTGFYSEMNLGFYRGEKRENVLENYNRISEEIGFSYKNLVMGEQVHADGIHHVTIDDIGKGIIKENDIKKTDGLITNIQNAVLTIFFADCVPIFFVDKNNKVIGVAHSGWKGTTLQIVSKMIDEMVNVYNSDIKDILVGIGPSICQDHFQVHKPVYDEFKKIFAYTDDFTYYRDNKYYIDLKNINKKMLVDKGVLIDNITVTDHCTVSDQELFYSHRVSGSDRGIMAGFIEISGV